MNLKYELPPKGCTALGATSLDWGRSPTPLLFCYIENRVKLAISDSPTPFARFTVIGKPTPSRFVSIKYMSSDLHNTLKKLAPQPIAYFAIPPQTQVPLKKSHYRKTLLDGRPDSSMWAQTQNSSS